jgi:hypothetical protein
MEVTGTTGVVSSRVSSRTGTTGVLSTRAFSGSFPGFSVEKAHCSSLASSWRAATARRAKRTMATIRTQIATLEVRLTI